jgi:Carboxypeptidase regulatory-like domain
METRKAAFNKGNEIMRSNDRLITSPLLRLLWTSLFILTTGIAQSGSVFEGIPVAYAQSSTATLSGTALDENGAVVPNVSVTVVNADTKLRRQVTTDKEGYFAILQLQTGR